MENAILAAYTAETVSSLMAFALCSIVLINRIQRKRYNSVFWFSAAITILFGALLVKRSWWTIWRDGYNSRDSVGWMINHPMVFFLSVGTIAGAVLVIKAMSEDSHNGRLWKISLGVVVFVFIMTLMKG